MAKTQIFSNYREFLDRADKAINGVTEAFAKEHNINLDVDAKNSGCWNCNACLACTDCTDCTLCVACDDCAELYGAYEKTGVKKEK